MPESKNWFTDENIELMCDLIENHTIGLRELHKVYPEIMPPTSTLFRELAVNEKLRERYARAKNIQCELMAEEIISIADDGSNDYMTVVIGDQVYQKENKELTRRSELRVDARKWVLSHLMPEKYGDKIDMTTKGKELPASTTAVNFKITRRKQP